MHFLVENWVLFKTIEDSTKTLFWPGSPNLIIPEIMSNIANED